MRKKAQQGTIVKDSVDNNIMLKQLYRESRFNPNAYSDRNAKGLAQIRDITIKELKDKKGMTIDPMNPKQAIKAHKTLMTDLYNKSWITKGNPTPENRLAKTLAAYNMGATGLVNILNEQKKQGKDIYRGNDWINALPSETQDYIKKITSEEPGYKEAVNSFKYKKHYPIKQNGGWLSKYQDGGKSKKFNSRLNKDQLSAFEEVSKTIPSLIGDRDFGAYDTQGFFKQLYKEHQGDKNKIIQSLTPGSEYEHVGVDTFKKPNHPTFSNESKYHIPFIRKGGNWKEEGYFNASKRNMKNLSNSEQGSAYDYFKQAEDLDGDGVPNIGLKHKGNVIIPPQYQNGGWLSKYQDGGVIKDNEGQLAHPGEVTEIDSPNITMKGVNYPVLGVSDTGDQKMMYPDGEYKFEGNKVTEYPVLKNGGWLNKYK